MNIKAWWENLKAERKAKQAQQKALGQVIKNSEKTRFSSHDASKKGHKHQHGVGFLTKWTEKMEDGNVIQFWKHRPGWNKPIPANNVRVALLRTKKDPEYLQKRILANS